MPPYQDSERPPATATARAAVPVHSVARPPDAGWPDAGRSVTDMGYSGPVRPVSGGSGTSGVLLAGIDEITARRSDVRRQLREQQRWQMVVLGLVTLLLLAGLPLFFGARDPVFASLDSLAVPAWAAANPVDDASGNRWCIDECRFRERATTSQRAWKETAAAYDKALTEAGWRRWQAPLCPEQPVNGSYTCWRRDELTLDLWVRERVCEGPAGQPVRGGQQCPGSAVTVKVRNAIADERTGPRPTTDPSLTGEDPDPVLTDDPLLDPTANPS
jgi:hypothetical protein